jgi:hypothetical protein
MPGKKQAIVGSFTSTIARNYDKMAKTFAKMA